MSTKKQIAAAAAWAAEMLDNTPEHNATDWSPREVEEYHEAGLQACGERDRLRLDRLFIAAGREVGLATFLNARKTVDCDECAAPRFASRRDAIAWVEDHLGPDGSRELAERFCDIAQWEAVGRLTEARWRVILDAAIAEGRS